MGPTHLVWEPGWGCYTAQSQGEVQGPGMTWVFPHLSGTGSASCRKQGLLSRVFVVRRVRKLQGKKNILLPAYSLHTTSLLWLARLNTRTKNNHCQVQVHCVVFQLGLNPMSLLPQLSWCWACSSRSFCCCCLVNLFCLCAYIHACGPR
jgi:hypothetical protein